MNIDKQQTRITELFELIEDNPHLPIVPMVDGEIVADDYSARWLGSWGCSEITKYYAGGERIYFYDEADMEDALTSVMGWDWCEAATEEEWLEKYRSLPWMECIAVDINLPD